ncbi:PEP-CTERM sorting domain-containing protein [Longivirga aurantiaca]|uniref:PEP-CTERM sorting domain-containing protein n=1 Tax=Longivirga aurantiaca TaxID=1837743 RepID=A0ABW1SZ95_9ACTN
MLDLSGRSPATTAGLGTGARTGYYFRRRRPARVDGIGVWGNWQPN